MTTMTAGLRAMLAGQQTAAVPPIAAQTRNDLQSAAPHRSVHLTPASSIQVRPVRWLWDLRLALGTLALLGGREGIGKSIVAYTIAGMLTRGRLPGAYLGIPKSVIVAATEDSWAHTIVPRLMATGADLDRVYRVDVTTSTGAETELSLPRDLLHLGQVITQVDAVLLVLDPLLSRLDAALDSHKDAEVRTALEPLVSLADKTQLTVLGLIHVNKSASTDALNALMGSRAFAAVARSVLFVLTDPENESARILGQAKNNLGRMDLPTLGFKIEGVKVADTSEGPVWTGQLQWTGESDRSIREALESAAEANEDKSATGEASDWLSDFLTDKGGSADSAEVRREGGKAGHSKNSLFRAKSKLGIASISSGFPRRAFWKLPVVPTSGETAGNGKDGNTGNTDAPVVPVGPLFPVVPGPRAREEGVL